MNSIIFLFQIISVTIASYSALKMGKEALVSLSVLFAILANFFVIKQISLFGWNATGSDAFAIGSLFTLNMLQQKYGKLTARHTIWVSFFCLWFFTFFSQIHLLYVPSLYDKSQSHFFFLLTNTPRLWIASITTFFIAQQLDLWIYNFFSRVSWKNRMVLSLLLSQAFDTVAFSFLGLFGIVDELGSIIVISYCIKCVIIFFTRVSTWVISYEV
jgi:queuosine precursor transporter